MFFIVVINEKFANHGHYGTNIPRLLNCACTFRVCTNRSEDIIEAKFSTFLSERPSLPLQHVIWQLGWSTYVQENRKSYFESHQGAVMKTEVRRLLSRGR